MSVKVTEAISLHLRRVRVELASIYSAPLFLNSAPLFAEYQVLLVYSALTTIGGKLESGTCRSIAATVQILPDDKPLEPPEAAEYTPVRIKPVVRLGRILHEPFAVLKPGSDYERVWFRRWIRRKASHEDAINLQHGGGA